MVSRPPGTDNGVIRDPGGPSGGHTLGHWYSTTSADWMPVRSLTGDRGMPTDPGTFVEITFPTAFAHWAGLAVFSLPSEEEQWTVARTVRQDVTVRGLT